MRKGIDVIILYSRTGLAVVHLIDVATPASLRVLRSLVIEVSGHNYGAIKRA